MIENGRDMAMTFLDPDLLSTRGVYGGLAKPVKGGTTSTEPIVRAAWTGVLRAIF